MLTTPDKNEDPIRKFAEQKLGHKIPEVQWTDFAYISWKKEYDAAALGRG